MASVAGQRRSRVAVVTGGGSGIGRAVCEELAAGGDLVAVLDIDMGAARTVADSLTGSGRRAIACAVDVSDRPSVGAAVDVVHRALGEVGILVTCAGVARFEPFLEISPESWRRVIDVNLTGTFNCAQAVLPDMVAAGWGRIVTISSSSAQRGSPRMAHYASSKGGVMTLMKVLAREFASYGITVNDIPPSAVDTPMSRQAQAGGDQPGPEVVARGIPVGRVGTPEDIAAACAFLCSDQAGYITGQVLGVNGGSVV